MIYEELFERLAAEFRFSFTEEQARAAAMLAEFVYTPIQRPAFILRGYAGTGKTTLIGALVKTLCELGRPVVLLAPTGRAAKVFAAHAAQEASTIHKVIYRQETFNGEQTRFNLNFNRLKDVLFIVDEASMLSG
ncbi:MAG: AAA family ATPase, partial [Alloprevotella tannerae]|nr:AAA family ATPase [Alloprevotella tannerae]